MTSDNNDANFSVSLPIGAAAGALLLAGALGAAYLLMGRNEVEGSEASGGSSKSGKNMFRRMGILGLVTLIENDATRKLVVAVLKAMARRS